MGHARPYVHRPRPPGRPPPPVFCAGEDRLSPTGPPHPHPHVPRKNRDSLNHPYLLQVRMGDTPGVTYGCLTAPGRLCHSACMAIDLILPVGMAPPRSHHELAGELTLEHLALL